MSAGGSGGREAFQRCLRGRQERGPEVLCDMPRSLDFILEMRGSSKEVSSGWISLCFRNVVLTRGVRDGFECEKNTKVPPPLSPLPPCGF